MICLAGWDGYANPDTLFCTGREYTGGNTNGYIPQDYGDGSSKRGKGFTGCRRRVVF